MTYIERNSNELYHHGIKGQKWGKRRFQNPDGTLTKEGKARYKAYNKDYKEYKTLNRHVSASQRHLKEEGVMLDRVRDKYQTASRAYAKEMSRSSGLFGLKAAKKATRVAKAQSDMDKIGGDYETAATAYGYANRLAKKDRKALTDHVDKMLTKYGKGSVKEIEYETVKIGQNKVQKILQGAPVSSLFGRERETDTFVKTGKTVADMPIIGNWYTANYTSDQEWKMKREDVERIRNDSFAKRKINGKKGKGPAYLDDDYFDGSSSIAVTKRERKAKAKKEAEAKAAEAKKEAKAKAAEAKKEAKAKAAEEKKEAEKKKKAKEKQAEKEQKAQEAYERSEEEDKKRPGTKVKKYARWMGHSATYDVRYSDELYHYGVIGMRWGIHKAVTYARDTNKHRYKQKVKALDSKHSKALRDGEGKPLTREQYFGAKARYKKELEADNKRVYKELGKIKVNKNKTVKSIYQKYKDKAIEEIPHYKLKRAAKVTAKTLGLIGLTGVGALASLGYARSAKINRIYSNVYTKQANEALGSFNNARRSGNYAGMNAATNSYIKNYKKANLAKEAAKWNESASKWTARSTGATVAYLATNKISKNNDLVDEAREEDKRKKKK